MVGARNLRKIQTFQAKYYLDFLYLLHLISDVHANQHKLTFTPVTHAHSMCCQLHAICTLGRHAKSKKNADFWRYVTILHPISPEFNKWCAPKLASTYLYPCHSCTFNVETVTSSLHLGRMLKVFKNSDFSMCLKVCIWIFSQFLRWLLIHVSFTYIPRCHICIYAKGNFQLQSAPVLGVHIRKKGGQVNNAWWTLRKEWCILGDQRHREQRC